MIPARRLLTTVIVAVTVTGGIGLATAVPVEDAYLKGYAAAVLQRESIVSALKSIEA